MQQSHRLKNYDLSQEQIALFAYNNLMLFSHTTFIGVDPTGRPRSMVYAAINRNLDLICLCTGSLEEINAFIGGQERAMIAICGPVRPNQGLMKREHIRQSLDPVPRPGRWTGFRVVEYQLSQHNIRMPRTNAETQNCPGWMQTSFELYQQCSQFGYQDYPSPDSSLQMLEAYPYATYAAILGCLPFKKNGFEGRMQRQLALYRIGLNIPDPMRIFEEITRHRFMTGVLPFEGLYTTSELDALGAAYTAWCAAIQPDQVTLLGNPEEGQIVVPVAELKSKY